MATASAHPTSLRTCGEVVSRLGDLPLSRIRTSAPAPGEAVESDVVELREHHDRLYELIDGTLVEKAMGWKESKIAGWILTILNNFVIPRKLGECFGADGMFRLASEQVRIPDVSFVSQARFADRTVEEGAFWELGFDLAVEVISPSNTRREMERKLDDYFAAGVQLVWLVYPRSREVVVYTSPRDSATLSIGDVLEGGTVLPGLSIAIEQIFV
jgi:Uma2 family endonuclease